MKGIRVCRQNKGYWREEFFRRHDPRGREYFWLTGAFVNSEPESTDTDEWALANGYVSVVPVQTDMTDYAQMAPLGGYSDRIYRTGGWCRRLGDPVLRRKLPGA